MIFKLAGYIVRYSLIAENFKAQKYSYHSDISLIIDNIYIYMHVTVQVTPFLLIDYSSVHLVQHLSHKIVHFLIKVPNFL